MHVGSSGGSRGWQGLLGRPSDWGGPANPDQRASAKDPATGRPRWRWRRCHVFRWAFRDRDNRQWTKRLDLLDARAGLDQLIPSSCDFGPVGALRWDVGQRRASAPLSRLLRRASGPPGRESDHGRDLREPPLVLGPFGLGA